MLPESKSSDNVDNKNPLDITEVRSETILPPREYKLLYVSILVVSFLHLSALYAVHIILWRELKLLTLLFTFFVLELSLLSASGGAHRLWSHKSYKATLPLKIFYGIWHTVAFHESIFTWCRNHRLHHKYPDDDADPYNPRRGYFFAHIGWLLVERHPRSIEKGRKLDLSDLLTDPVVTFQKKYYWPLVALLAVGFPVLLPVYLWNESLLASWHLNILRWTVGMHCVAIINSLAHACGNKPYDRRIGPSDHWLYHAFTLGDGCHNYHHVFPWDYRSIEYNTFYFNFVTWFIDMMAKWGHAYDLRSASENVVNQRATKYGNANERPSKIR